jgi:NAD(P)-dependent dehydrogenase (short-subunit alcohol dehydrogenase family)
MTQPYLDDPEIARELRALIPAGRFGDPGELGALVSLLLSPEGAFLTGGCITIDGGRSV